MPANYIDKCRMNTAMCLYQWPNFRYCNEFSYCLITCQFNCGLCVVIMKLFIFLVWDCSFCVISCQFICTTCVTNIIFHRHFHCMYGKITHLILLLPKVMVIVLFFVDIMCYLYYNFFHIVFGWLAHFQLAHWKCRYVCLLVAVISNCVC